MDVWAELGIGPAADARQIKRAYAARLKQLDLSRDRDAFARLRAAYEAALAHAWDAGTASGAAPPGAAQPDPAAWPRAEDEPARPSGNPAPVPGAPAGEDDGPARRVEDLLRLAQEQGETAAVQELARLVDSDRLGALDLRHDFEERLMWALGHSPTRWGELLRVASACFAWPDAGDYWYRRNPLAYARVMHALAMDQRWRELHALARCEREGLRASVPRPQCVAAQLLLGPFDPKRFWLHAFSRPVMSAVTALLDELEQQWAPLLLDLDPRTVRWWRRAAIHPRLTSGHLLAAVVLAVFGLGFLSSKGAASGDPGRPGWLFLQFVAAYAVALGGMGLWMWGRWWLKRRLKALGLALVPVLNQTPLGRFLVDAASAPVGWFDLFSSVALAFLMAGVISPWLPDGVLGFWAAVGLCWCVTGAWIVSMRVSAHRGAVKTDRS